MHGHMKSDSGCLVCNTKHIYFCHESAINLIRMQPLGLSLELTSVWTKAVTGTDPPHISSVSFELLGIAKHQSTGITHRVSNRTFHPIMNTSILVKALNFQRRAFCLTSQWNQCHPWLDYKAHHTEACMLHYSCYNLHVYGRNGLNNSTKITLSPHIFLDAVILCH